MLTDIMTSERTITSRGDELIFVWSLMDVYDTLYFSKTNNMEVYSAIRFCIVMQRAEKLPNDKEVMIMHSINSKIIPFKLLGSPIKSSSRVENLVRSRMEYGVVDILCWAPWQMI